MTKKLLKNWGWFEKLPNDSWSFVPQMNLQGWSKVRQFSQNPMIKFGNDFGKSWLDHTSIPHDHWWFYDNPEISHFTYPNPANPLGHKSFIRLTPSALFTTTEHSQQGGTGRINDILTDLAGQTMYWHDIVMPRTVFRNNSRKVLICPSSPNCHRYYYGEDRKDWVSRQQNLVNSLGLVSEVWNKPTRDSRTSTTDTRLYNRLLSGDILCTISQHSASAMETILAGVPAVVMGAHGTGELGTPILEFATDGTLRTPQTLEVELWVDCVLSNTRHKEEMKTDTWQQ